MERAENCSEGELMLRIIWTAYPILKAIFWYLDDVVEYHVVRGRINEVKIFGFDSTEEFTAVRGIQPAVNGFGCLSVIDHLMAKEVEQLQETETLLAKRQYDDVYDIPRR